MKRTFFAFVLALCLLMLVSCRENEQLFVSSGGGASSEISSSEQSSLSSSQAQSEASTSSANSSTFTSSPALTGTGQGNIVSSQKPPATSKPAPKPKPTLQEIKEANSVKIKKIISKHTNDNMTPLEKAKAIYNWLYPNFGYRAVYVDLSSGFSEELTHQLAAHYFRYYRGSCEHYAAVSRLFFEEFGYECIYVKGTRYSNLSRRWGEHVWLMVNVNGDWYHVDGLFAGNFAKVMDDYFCVPDSKMEKTHKWDKENLPACTKEQILK
ncbi:MAG: transglutaminase domain-containing protein [Ruminococcaceae bacterium]|nr:transglutaminase domain-containing protein [Oscillospiraceae bacterium]